MAMYHVHRFNCPVAILLAVQILEHQVLNVIVVSSPYWNSVKVVINLVGFWMICNIGNNAIPDVQFPSVLFTPV